MNRVNDRKEYAAFLGAVAKIGCIGFGGGSALIPVIEEEIVKKQNLDTKENIDKDVVVASITPGALPVEIVSSIGRRCFGTKGMIMAAVMMALPGAFVTILMMTLLSVLQSDLLSMIETASVGVSAFIIYLLVKYVVNVVKTCRKESKNREIKAVLLMIVVFVLVCGKNLHKIFGIEGTPLFAISTVQILALAFFCMFYSRSNYNVKNVTVMLVLGTIFLLGNGKAQIISVPYLLQAVQVLMLALAVWGVYQNGREKKWKFSGDKRQLFRETVIWFALLGVFSILAVLAERGALVFVGKGCLSALMSFGGGDAYLTIADGLFVESGMITEHQYYSQIVPVVNVLPGSILCKTLAGVGYYIGFNTTGSAVTGIIFAAAGFVSSIAVSCGFFMMIYHLYDSLQMLWAFQMVSRWIRPIIAGMLLNIILSLANQCMAVVGAHSGGTGWGAVPVLLGLALLNAGMVQKWKIPQVWILVFDIAAAAFFLYLF